MKSVSRATTTLAIGLMKEGRSTREVAQLLGISSATASRIRQNDQENIPDNKGGRPRKISQEMVEFLKVNLKRKELKSVAQATNKANETLPRPVSVSTVRRRLTEAGLTAKKVVIILV